MTLTLLDLYNASATQEWAMYDNGANQNDELEAALVLAINKAILSVYYSYPFKFRERTQLIMTINNENQYCLPYGLIKQDKEGNYSVKFNGKRLSYEEEPNNEVLPTAIPTSFSLNNDSIILNAIPNGKNLLTIDYLSLCIGVDKDDNEIFELKNADDSLIVPEYLEELMKNAIITRTLLNSIAAETDENYSAYKKQADKAYNLLVKYSKLIIKEKKVRF